MGFTDVPLRRSIPAGVLAYAAGYLATYLAVASRSEALLREVTVELQYGGGGVESLLELVSPTPESWKVAGWFFHAAQWSKVVSPQLPTGGAVRLDLVARIGGEYLALYLVAPVALALAGYAVARTGRTPGIRGEDYAGAAVAFGYFPCAVAGGLLYTVGRPAVAPDLFTTFAVVGIAYPVLFGWLGGRAARARARPSRSAEPTPMRE